MGFITDVFAEILKMLFFEVFLVFLVLVKIMYADLMDLIDSLPLPPEDQI
jgi:hypothetical protein